MDSKSAVYHHCVGRFETLREFFDPIITVGDLKELGEDGIVSVVPTGKKLLMKLFLATILPPKPSPRHEEPDREGNNGKVALESPTPMPNFLKTAPPSTTFLRDAKGNDIKPQPPSRDDLFDPSGTVLNAEGRCLSVVLRGLNPSRIASDDLVTLIEKEPLDVLERVVRLNLAKNDLFDDDFPNVDKLVDLLPNCTIIDISWNRFSGTSQSTLEPGTVDRLLKSLLDRPKTLILFAVGNRLASLDRIDLIKSLTDEQFLKFVWIPEDWVDRHEWEGMVRGRDLRMVRFLHYRAYKPVPIHLMAINEDEKRDLLELLISSGLGKDSPIYATVEDQPTPIALKATVAPEGDRIIVRRGMRAAVEVPVTMQTLISLSKVEERNGLA